ncbi:polysaccharide biosynthesis protein [Pelagibacterium sp.]|uniref:polysaccharide biosynthesis protein n=1 Tax=Pelagibacterium sp. TaxID=1967288 RepID=UPI003A8E5B60
MIARIRTSVLAFPRRTKQAVIVAFDFLALSFALWVSLCLRYDSWLIPVNTDQLIAIVSAPLVAIPVFIRMGLYRAIVRYMPERALWAILRAVLVATMLWVLAMYLTELVGRGAIPRSVPVIYFALGTFIIAGSRFTAKKIFLTKPGRLQADRRSVVIYGAGEAGGQLSQALRNTHHIVGFLDDNPALHRRELAGIKIYNPDQLNTLVDEYDVLDVILSIPSLPAQRRREIVASINARGVKIMSLPPIADLVTGKYLVSQIKEIDIVDLLGRSSIPPDSSLIGEMIVGRSILVTGAGGSIGSELCRKIAQWAPRRLVLFEANEFALYQIEQELGRNSELVIVPVLASVTDEVRVRETLTEHDINVVFHAAAHKHVPLVEANALEGMRNNVIGTSTLVDAAYDHGVEHFVLISTDKAVRPTNVMGATKRWAELIVGRAAARAKAEGSRQRFCAVRFGNVLGSNGSVVPLFRKQIEHGGPVTLTDMAMTRYFMSIEEAAELIVQAGALSEGGDVFLLDMGSPILISDLAENMIRLAGLTVRDTSNPDGDIEIVVTGKRPGEKLYEELFYDAGSAERTSHAKIMRAATQGHNDGIAEAVDEIRSLLQARNEQQSRRFLFEIVDKSS